MYRGMDSDNSRLTTYQLQNLLQVHSPVTRSVIGGLWIENFPIVTTNLATNYLTENILQTSAKSVVKLDQQEYNRGKENEVIYFRITVSLRGTVALTM